MGNAEIADLFDEVADLLEIQAANPYRVRAYRNASRVIRNWPVHLASVVKEKKTRDGNELTLPKMPGIGEDLTQKIIEVIFTRNLKLLEDLRKQTPHGLLALLRLPGLGPKRVARLQDELGVRSARELKRAILNGSLRKLTGFGTRTEQKLLEELERSEGEARPAEERRITLAVAEQVADELLLYLRNCRQIVQVEVAGSFRRRQETIGDLDLLASCARASDQARIMDCFKNFDEVDRVVSEGLTRSTVILRSGVQVDLRVVPVSSYGAALHYFTGSKAHNIAIRSLGVRQGLKINEYGIFKGKRQVGGQLESDVFERVGLPWIPPELRENAGEIEAARRGRLPSLVTLEEIRGDLHAHTKATDGRLGIAEMAMAARALGYEYLAITDHSKRLTVAHGLDPERLRAQIREIDRLNRKLRGFRILKATEVDILKDGSLDLPDSILSQLDIVVGSIHSHFELSPEKQLERVLRAMDHPYMNVLGHPSARLIGRRKPLELDLEKVIIGAAERGCFLELNSQPERMDLSDVYCRLAKKVGARMVISTDAHSDHDLKYMRFGVAQARRGWLEASDILNTRPWAEVEKLLRKPVRRMVA